jgi:hypothetical protein
MEISKDNGLIKQFTFLICPQCRLISNVHGTLTKPNRVLATEIAAKFSKGGNDTDHIARSKCTSLVINKNQSKQRKERGSWKKNEGKETLLNSWDFKSNLLNNFWVNEEITTEMITLS